MSGSQSRGSPASALTAINSQRAIRHYARRSIPDSVMTDILEAARRAPSAKNRQHWAFVVCTESPTLAGLSAAGPHAGHLRGAAAAVALVTPVADGGRPSALDLYDLGHVTQNMMLAAVAHGVGSAHAMISEQELVRSLLRLPGSHWCDFVIGFGYPRRPLALSRPREVVNRRALSDLVHREHW